MSFFLCAWSVAFVALGSAVLGLSFVYRILGSDFGTEGWLRETVTALVTSAMHAGTFMLVLLLHDDTNEYTFRATYFLAFIATYLVYKVTHLEEMTDLELGILVITNSLMFRLMWLGVVLFVVA